MPTFELETRLHCQGFSLVAGVDEVGRGPLAGPVMAAAVILPSDLLSTDQQSLPHWLSLVDDSKALTPLQRRKALEHIEAHATAIGLGMATPQEIDLKGIGEATRWAMRRAIDDLPLRPSYLLIDFIHPKYSSGFLNDHGFQTTSALSSVKPPECSIPFQALVRGDSLSYSIAAASIVAKVTRDRLMEGADAIYPGYEFSRHKGYPTSQHLRLLALQGPCPIHRRSFGPLRTGADSKKWNVVPPLGVTTGTRRPVHRAAGPKGSQLAMSTARSRLGARGEGVAREYLKASGYEIEANNFRCPLGEVDIIAWDRACLVFVEVRTRRDTEYGTPEESLTKQKQHKLIATAETYIQSRSTPPEEWRIDLIGVRLSSRGAIERVEHIENAIQLS